MSLVSFLNDLGIIPNEGTGLENDPNLLQGQQYKEYGRLYAAEVRPRLAALQVTSIPGIDSIVETLDTASSTKSTQKNQASNVGAIEKEFNKTLHEYTQTYQTFSEELMRKSQTQKDTYKFYNKVLTSGDGNYTYVNDYGYTHRYSTDAWSNNSPSCPTDPMSVTSDDMAKLKNVGPNMGSGQACGIAGSNIKNESGEAAWADIEGYKHVYSSDVWKAKNSTCDVPAISLSNAEYDAIPSGNAMTSTTVCDQLDVDPNVWSKLNKLNSKLLSLAEAMGKELSELVVTDIRLKQAVEQQQQQLNTHISTLNDDKARMDHHNQRFITIEGERESTGLVLQSNWYHYLVWFVLAVTVLAITAHTMTTGDPGRAASGVTLIVAIVALYVIVRWLYRRYA